MEPNPITNKLLIPTRPYNRLLDTNSSIFSMDSGQGKKLHNLDGPEFTPKPFDPVSMKLSEISDPGTQKKSETEPKNKIIVPPRSYNIPSLQDVNRGVQDKNNKNDFIFEVKKQFDKIRNNLKDNLRRRIKIMEEEAGQELIKINKIEDELIASLGLNTFNANSVDSASESVSENQLFILPKSSENKKIRVRTKKRKDLVKIVLKSTEKLEILEPAQSPILFYGTAAEVHYSLNMEKLKSCFMPNANNSMNFLIINNNRILVSGIKSGRSILIVDILKETFYISNKIATKKKFEALSFLGDSVAMIGGETKNGLLGIVESFDGFKFVSHSKLNLPRSRAQAIKHLGYTYVFGGNTNLEDFTVEKFDNGWRILEITPIYNVLEFGLVSYKDDILLFGGSISVWSQNKVYRFVPGTGEFKQEKDMPVEASVRFNTSVTYAKDTFYFIDPKNMMINSYNLETIM